MFGITWNYPPAHQSTGGQTVPTPKGLKAPVPALRPDVTLDQRRSEYRTTFGTILPLQHWLRQRVQIAVNPSTVPAHQLRAPDNAIAPGGGHAGNPGGTGEHFSGAYARGDYNTDYSLQTQMGSVHLPNLTAPYRIENGPIIDVQLQVILNGQYSTVNTDLSSLYTNLRAPSPWEGMIQCQ